MRTPRAGDGRGAAARFLRCRERFLCLFFLSRGRCCRLFVGRIRLGCSPRRSTLGSVPFSSSTSPCPLAIAAAVWLGRRTATATLCFTHPAAVDAGAPGHCGRARRPRAVSAPPPMIAKRHGITHADSRGAQFRASHIWQWPRRRPLDQQAAWPYCKPGMAGGWPLGEAPIFQRRGGPRLLTQTALGRPVVRGVRPVIPATALGLVRHVGPPSRAPCIGTPLVEVSAGASRTAPAVPRARSVRPARPSTVPLSRPQPARRLRRGPDACAPLPPPPPYCSAWRCTIVPPVGCLLPLLPLPLLHWLSSFSRFSNPTSANRARRHGLGR